MESIWSYDVFPSPWHFLVAVYFAFSFVVARFFLDRFLFRRAAAWLLGNGSVPLKINDTRRAKIVKCSESMWKLTYYATVEACILKIAYNEPWFRDTKDYFRGWPDQELKLPLKLFYMCQCGFYIYSIAALLAWETRRKDFAVMMSHHVITVILIGYSYLTRYSFMSYASAIKLQVIQNNTQLYSLVACWFLCLGIPRNNFMDLHFMPGAASFSLSVFDLRGVKLELLTSILRFFRIGSIVLALHDASDVFMEAAKVFKYSEKELAASVFFGCFAVSWLVSRLIFFPFWVIKSSSYDLCEFLPLSEAFGKFIYYIFNTMLLMLLVFHIYWWVLICSMIRRQLKNRGKVGEDIRSDSEDDD